MSEKIYVQACEGKVVPLHRSDAPNGVENYRLAPEAGPLEVPNSTTIRRRIASGDLERVATPVTPPVSPPPSTPPPDMPSNFSAVPPTSST